jgi:protein TonB
MGCILTGSKTQILAWFTVPTRWRQIPAVNTRLFLTAAAISLLIHALSWLSFNIADRSPRERTYSPVKIRTLTTEEQQRLNQSAKDLQQPKQILETPLTPTAAPEKPSRLGAQDHATQKETKLRESLLNNTKGLDAANPLSASTQTTPQKPAVSNAAPPPVPAAIPKVITGPGSLIIGAKKTEEKKPYEKLFPDSAADVVSNKTVGHTERIDAEVAEGDRIDMNTSSFKYISYFSGFRKQIELAWIYPGEAIRRGLQGTVLIEITIEKNGKVSKVRVVESSGYQLLDSNIISTIKTASPFAPLPKAWSKERLVVTGAFRYQLSYTGH